MAKQIPSNFTRYELTEQEDEQSKRFTQLNVMYLRNLLCDASERKTKLTVDREQLDKYIQDEACLTGVITTLESLIQESEELEQATRDEQQAINSSLNPQQPSPFSE